MTFSNRALKRVTLNITALTVHNATLSFTTFSPVFKSFIVGIGYLFNHNSSLRLNWSFTSLVTSHRRSQGVQWVHLHPHGGEKIARRNLQGNV